ncbi:MAG: SDR family NAD(P)-dependent oxidoreductase [Marinobacterium sp.]
MQRTVVITGGASGIGLAIAERFVELGDRVFNLDISPGSVGETLICDVTDHQAVTNAVNQVAAENGIDVVVSNAGRHLSANIENTTEADFVSMFDLNVKGAFSLVQAAVPHMKERGGSIVFIGSDQSSVAKSNSCAYNMTKHALASLAKTTAIDYAQFNIRSNIVCPGTIETPLYTKAVEAYCARSGANLDDVHQAEADEQPIGRIGQPSEVAAMVAYLCSDEAGFVTGAMLPIDGGYTAR